MVAGILTSSCQWVYQIDLLLAEREIYLGFAFFKRLIWGTKWKMELPQAVSSMTGQEVLLWSGSGLWGQLGWAGPPFSTALDIHDGIHCQDEGRGNHQHLHFIVECGQNDQLEHRNWIYWHLYLSSPHGECLVPKLDLEHQKMYLYNVNWRLGYNI